MALLSQEMMYSKGEKSAPIPILYLTHSMQVGGIEVIIYEFVCRLNNNGFLPSVCVFKGGGSLEAKLKSQGVKVYCLEKKEGIDLRLPLRLRRILKKESIRILHTHNFSAWLYGAVAARRIKGLRHVHTEHSNVDKKRRALAERVLSYFTNIVVCVSKDVRQSMIENQGILPERVTVIHNGVDIEKFRPDPEKRIFCRTKLSVKQNTPLIGIVARLAPIKNHASLLKAFSKLSEDMPDLELLVVGDGELKNKLVKQTNEMNLTRRVLFLGERQDIPELLNAIDVFVLPSLSEGHNMTLLEAMATGLPVVATSVGGNLEIVEDGVTGYLIPSKQPEILGQKIAMLLKNETLRSQMGKRGRTIVLKHFDMQKMTKAYQALYLSLIQAESDTYEGLHD